MHNTFITRYKWVGLLLAFVLGYCFHYAFSPYNLSWLVYPILGSVFYLASLATKKQAVAIGYVFGLGIFIGGCFWVYISLAEHGGVLPIAAFATNFLFCAVMAIFPAVAMGIAVLINLKNRMMQLSIIFPSCWILMEWVRGWFLTGFPWLSVGYTQTDSNLLSLAPLIGVYGIGLVVAVLSGLFFSCLLTKKKHIVFSLISMVAIFYALVHWRADYWRATLKTDVNAINVTILQGNYDIEKKWDDDFLAEQLGFYGQTTLTLLDETDLIVMPETALPLYLDQAQKFFIDPISQHAKEKNTAIITGIPFREDEKDGLDFAYNAAIGLGLAEGLYKKIRLVPLGEFFPFKGLLALVPGFDVPLSDLSPGSYQQEGISINDQLVGMTICYEDVFGDFIGSVFPEAALLVNLSNDAWFGEIAPYQHLQMARMRAAETEKYMVRATNTGISAIIDARGKLIATSKLNQQAQIAGQVQWMNHKTWYLKYGDAPIIVLLLLAILVVVVLDKKSPCFREF